MGHCGAMTSSEEWALEDEHAARTYAPLPVQVARGDGAWVETLDGERYLDLVAAYSALNFGHRHPRLVAAARRQLDELTLTSRAYHAEVLGPYCRDLADLCGMDAVVPMNTGAEAVETAIKVARRWGYRVKGVHDGTASIVVFDGNFHGRTITLCSASGDPDVSDQFGPFTPGFVRVPFGDADAVERVLDDTTVAVLVEPIQGEAGVVVPPDGFLPALRELCSDRNLLLVADEIQSGLGRTGATFACEHAGVRPDVYVLGKALGGGIVPTSAVVADHRVLDVLTPGSHGSTFGGNPLACAVGREVVALLQPGDLQRRAADLGTRMHARLARAVGHGAEAITGRGLWAGIRLDETMPSARVVCEQLLERRVIAKDTHDRVVRIAPPIVIDERDLDWAVDQLIDVVTRS